MAASSSQTGKRKLSELPPETMMVERYPPSLKQWWRETKLFENHKNEVTKIIGQLPLLMNDELISRRDLICALYQFWDPSRNTFRFSDFEMTPTLEELASLASLELEGKGTIAPKKPNQYDFFKHLKLIPKPSPEGVNTSWVTHDYLYDRFGQKGGFQDYRKEFYVNLTFDQWMDLRPRAFVIAFLGLMVFPTYDHRISLRIGNVVNSFFEKRKNSTIIPMILGSIFRALTKCRENKESFFQGCNLLLQIWFVEHLLPRLPPSMPNHRLYSIIHEHPGNIKGMALPGTEKEWSTHLQGLRSVHILWQLKCLPLRKVIVGSLEHPFLPLMGLYGCQPYAPARVLRQLGRMQEIPLVEAMTAFSFDYDDENQIPYSTLWGLWDRRIVAEEDTQMVDRFAGIVSKEYREWYRNQPKLEARPPRSRVGITDMQTSFNLRLKKEMRQHDQRLQAEVDTARAALAESQEMASGHLRTIARLKGLLNAAHVKEKQEAEASRKFRALLGETLEQHTELEQSVQTLTQTVDEVRRDRDAAYAAREELTEVVNTQHVRLENTDAAIGAMRYVVHNLARFVADSILAYERMPPEEIGRQAIPVIGKVTEELVLMRDVLDTVPPPE